VKLVVLTSSRFGTASVCIPVLAESPDCTIARVIISRGLNRNRTSLWRRKLKKTLQIGPLGALNGIRMRAWYQGPQTPDALELCQRLGIPVFETDRTNSEETIRLFEDAAADLGLSLGNGYISERISNIPKFGMINVHGERLPEYQNAQSVIWPIYHMEANTGLTIHQIDRRIDAGEVLYREELPIVFCPKLEDTVRSTIEVTQRRTPAALRHVCENYERLRANATPQENGRRFTTPSIRQYLRMVRNNGVLYRKSGDRRVASTYTVGK